MKNIINDGCIRIILGALATSLLFTFVVGCGGGTSGTGGRELSGQTLDVSDKALPGVRIGVSDDSGNPIAETLSDSEGNFSVANIYSSSATIEAQYGDMQATKTIVSFPDNGESISLTFKRRRDGTFSTSVRSLSKATRHVFVSGNLDERGYYPTPIVSANLIDSVGPQYSAKLQVVNATCSFSFPVKVVDSLGIEHTMYVAFYRIDRSTFKTAIYVQESDVRRGKSRSDILLLAKKEFSIRFGKNGKRSDNTSTRVADVTLVIPWANGASKSSIKFNFASLILSARYPGITSVKYR